MIEKKRGRQGGTEGRERERERGGKGGTEERGGGEEIR